MQALREQFVWSEKYRPQTIADCILPESIKTMFQEFITKGEVPHLLLSGGPGVGKTTVAKALCDELGCDWIVINGSLDSGIDTLRTRIMNFASSVSMMGEGHKTKVVIIDEADYLNPTSTQPALRGFMQDYASNCRFIFTCNFKNKIIPPLHSRMVEIDFRLSKADKPAMAAQFMKRLMVILKEEGITYDKKVVIQLLTKRFPDYRKVLDDLQRYSTSGAIDDGILLDFQDISVGPLIEALKEKDFKKMRTWVVNNSDQDSATIFRKLYDTLVEDVKQVPQLVLLLADYQYKAAFSVDPEINMVACLLEIMAAVEFK